MRSGDFSNDKLQTTPLNNPNGGTYGYQLPSVSPIAQKLLALYPLPNVGDPNVFTGGVNYIANEDNSYHSNQFDIRGDQYIGKKLQVFGRFPWKNIDQAVPTALLVPSKNTFDDYRMFVVSASYSLRSNLVNEFRFGFTRNNSGYSNPFDGKGFASRSASTASPTTTSSSTEFPSSTSTASRVLTSIASAASTSPTFTNTPTR